MIEKELKDIDSPEEFLKSLTNMENGLLVNDSDCNGFVTAIQTLLGDRKLAKQISNTAYAYTRQYDWEAVKNHWANILT